MAAVGGVVAGVGEGVWGGGGEEPGVGAVVDGEGV